MGKAIQHWDGLSWKNSEFYRNHTMGKAIIVCGGPSLADIDITKLSGPGKTVIGMNTTYPHVRPDIWFGMDNPRCYDRNLMLESFPKIYRGGYWTNIIQGVTLRDVPNSHFMSIYKQLEEDYWKCFNEDNEAFHWDTNSFMAVVAFTLSMGFKDIYLVGCDLTNKKSDYFDDRKLIEDEKDSNTRLHTQLFNWLRRIQPKINSKGVTLHSMTPRSRINKFLPYTTLEDLNKEVEEELLFEQGPWYNSLTLQRMLEADVNQEDIK